ncbi:MAG: RiPP maturation radical SAM C-methyltransferase [Acidobacteriota bacterium]
MNGGPVRMAETGVDVCLVYMPYAPIEPPPLGIALLAGGARRAGLSVAALYPSFMFAERIGYFVYRAVLEAIGGFQIAEWTFSKVAFADFRPDDETFLSEYLDSERRHDPAKFDLLFRDEGSFLEALQGIRAAAEPFINELAREIMERQPKIVGCSSTYYQNCSSLALLRKLKELSPGTITMMGGANCEGSMGVVVKRAFPWVDVVVSGEADELFVPLCRRLLEPGKDALGQELPSGVFTSRIQGETPAMDAPVAMVTGLSELPLPDYSEYFEERASFSYETALSAPSLSIETSRGCWWGHKGQCAFCGGNGQRICYRAKRPDQVLLEIGALSDRYSVSRFVATDNILDLSYFTSVLRELAGTDPPMYSFFFSVASNLSEAQCKRLVEAGVTRMQPGIESLHDELLALMNKGNTAVGNIALLKFACENGIKTTWNILVDIPGEQDEWYGEMAELIPLIAHLQPPHKIMSVHFERFSSYHRDQARHGLALTPHRWYSYVYPLTPGELHDFARLFENQNRAAPGETRGRRALEKAALAWMQSHSRGESEQEPPMLTVREENGRSVIRDTRPCAIANEAVLDDIAAVVYRACHAPRSLETLSRILGSSTERFFSGAAISRAVEDLSERRLLLQLSGRHLALALREPLKPFVYPPDYSLPRLQSVLSRSGKSYWRVLEALDRQVASRHLSILLA